MTNVSIKNEESNFELIQSWVKNKKVTNCNDGYGGAITAAKEFKFLLLEERKVYYKQGLTLAVAYEKHIMVFDQRWRRSEDFFLGLPEKELDKRIAYFNYVEKIKELGRSIEDIFEIEPSIIYEIEKLEQPERYEEIENFVLKNKVGVNHLKRVIEIIKENDKITLEEALQQSKNEYKNKREEIKSGTRLQMKYQILRRRYKAMENSYNNFMEQYKINEKENRKMQRKNAKLLELNDELKKEVKQLKETLNKMDRNTSQTDNLTVLAAS